MLTSGSVLYSSTPFSAPSLAAFIASLISSLVAGFGRFTSSDTSDTFGVGTRIEVPSSLPFSSGITRPTALAAPVLVGIIDTAAARARCRSLCSVSTVLLVAGDRSGW